MRDSVRMRRNIRGVLVVAVALEVLANLDGLLDC
jgi:hypothetical protein